MQTQVARTVRSIGRLPTVASIPRIQKAAPAFSSVAASIFDARDALIPAGNGLVAPAAGMPANGTQVIQKGVAEGCYSAALSNAEYHAVHTHISHSGMLQLLRSPAHYQAYINGENRVDKTAPNFGTGAHTALLEPDRFDDEYVVYPRRRSGKEWEAFQAKHPGKVICNEDEMKRWRAIQEAVKNFKDFPLWQLMRSSVAEVEKSIFWVDEETSVCCRMRADLFSEEGLFDVKTIDDARPQAVTRQVVQMQYDLQAGMYQEGGQAYTGKRLPFFFIFIEEKAPHGIWLYPAGDTVIRNGLIKFRRGVKAFAQLTGSPERPCYQNAISTLELPRYALEVEDL